MQTRFFIFKKIYFYSADGPQKAQKYFKPTFYSADGPQKPQNILNPYFIVQTKFSFSKPHFELQTKIHPINHYWRSSLSITRCARWLVGVTDAICDQPPFKASWTNDVDYGDRNMRKQVVTFWPIARQPTLRGTSIQLLFKKSPKESFWNTTHYPNNVDGYGSLKLAQYESLDKTH